MNTEIMQRLEETDFDALVKDAIGAARAVFTEGWDAVEEFVEKAAKNLGEVGASLARMVAREKITHEEAKLLLEDERILIRMHLRTVVGMALLTAQRVLTAILGVLKGALNRIVGFELV
jgi:hypothetical protein